MHAYALALPLKKALATDKANFERVIESRKAKRRKAAPAKAAPKPKAAPEVLPMAIVRPLTGSGSVGVLADLVKTFGEDSLIVKMAATMFGSSETTFYVIAVYFGAVGIRRTRHALPAGLLADFAAALLSVYVVRWMFA